MPHQKLPNLSKLGCLVHSTSVYSLERCLWQRHYDYHNFLMSCGAIFRLRLGDNNPAFQVSQSPGYKRADDKNEYIVKFLVGREF
ncbi:hypothetical protein Btru_043996 [Bulinus truncatus]|nr:hypothetical protein Btru_043996 [Bulinus truncatus]